MTETPKLVCIVGSTAVGKTQLALEICRRWDGEIVGADASQIYTGFDIGTGKATAEELDGVPHHLLDVCAPDGPFDAERYRVLADAAIAEVHGRGKRVVVCGGTGLYLRALLHGLCEAPPITSPIREALLTAIADGQSAALHAELALGDPRSAARISPNDAQRLERALGVLRSTGRALSDWQAEHAFKAQRYPALIIGLRRSRDDLRGRIERRVAQMFQTGLVEEVAGLIAAGWGAQLRSMNALGYRLVAQALAGELTMAEAQAKTVTASWRYAKRQLTWFKKVEGLRWIDVPVSGALDPAQIDEILRPFWAPGEQR